MSRHERWAWAVSIVLMLAAARVPLHRATAALPVSNDDAIPLMMAERALHGELSTILWNQPYNGTLDAYLLAPALVPLSPHAAFRVYEALCGLALIALAGLLARAAAGERAGWAAALLAACGTPYAALMAALGPTPNFLVPLLVGVVTLAGYRSITEGPDGNGHANGHENANENGWRLLASGLVCGLAIWDSFLALPALVGAAAGLLAAGIRPRVRTLAWIALGIAAGAAPLLIARLTGASGATPVTALRPRWLWTAGMHDLARAASGLFGIDVPLVVDGPERAALPLAAAVLLAAALVALLARGAAIRRAWPLALWALALAGAFALSRRTGGDEVRYLFGLALPVLALLGVGLAALAERRNRRILAAAALAGLVGPWLIGHRLVLAAWRDPEHATRVWQVPPLDAVRDVLARAGIRTAYASLQFAGRLTVETAGAVIASQAWNERIPGDPLRYRDVVDLDPRPAWVLSPSLSRGMPRAAGFRELVAEAGGAAREEAAGGFVVFHDFRPPYDEARPIPSAAFALRTMDGAALPAALLDRDRATRWTSPAGLARGSGVVVSFAAPRRVSAIALLIPVDSGVLAVPWVAEADGAVVARGPARFALQWVNGAPRAGRQALLVIPLRDRVLGEVRVLFQAAGPPLTLAEVFAYGPDEAERPAAGRASAEEAWEHARRDEWRDAARLYDQAARAEPDRASHHASALRAEWRTARRGRVDVESLDDGGPDLFGPRSGPGW
jgi:hypothetical protein